MKTAAIRLSDVKQGSTVKIISLPDGVYRSQFIRLGIFEGQMITCLEKLPGGTLVVRKNRQEVAIGGDLAKKILVSLN